MEKSLKITVPKIGDTFKVLLGIMFFVSVLFIIGISLTIKISNATLMYR